MVFIGQLSKLSDFMATALLGLVWPVAYSGKY